MNGLIGGLIVLGVIGLYLLTYVLNKSIPVPEGTIALDKCSTCSGGACSVDIKAEFDASKNDNCDIYEVKEELYN